MSGFRPKATFDGSRSAPPIPVTAIVSALYGDDPSKRPTRVQFDFGPTERARVDEAVVAFIETLEAERDGAG